MRVTMHQQAEGVSPGETVDVDEERGKWLLANGYAITDETTPEDDPAGSRPTKSAPKAEWIEFAVVMGSDREDAEALTKDELIDRFG